MTRTGPVLFVIAVVQLVVASANFLYEFVQDEADHPSQYGDNPQA